MPGRGAILTPRSEDTVLDRLQSQKLAALLSLGLLTSSLQANTIISAQFQGTGQPIFNFQGSEADAAAADPAFANSNQWNHLQPDTTTFPNLLTSTGANSGASFSTDLNGGDETRRPSISQPT